MEASIYELIKAGGFACSCGMDHRAALEAFVLRRGALEEIPAAMSQRGLKKAFIVTDKNEYEAAGRRVCGILSAAGIAHSIYTFPQEVLEPAEEAVGAVCMHFDHSCDLVLAVGSGVVNDISKILANISGRAYFIAATAPSMDGYASATSSMSMDGLKVSLNSRCPSVIFADLDVLCNAPLRSFQSGLGDMVAKYISICEWRMAHLLLGEYYCPVIADMVRDAVEKCVRNAPALARREEQAVAAVMEGLVVTGIAMSYVGLSRPASGMEHYFSHIWDMRSLEFGTPGSTHGIQCGIGTLLALQAYEKLVQRVPDRQKALEYVAAFDREAWNAQLTAFLGKGAAAMIAGENREGKYDKQRHQARLERIIALWPQLLQIIRQELPQWERVVQALESVGAPTKPEEIGQSDEVVRTSFTMTKDIRDKYIGTRLLWDLGLLEEAAQQLL